MLTISFIENRVKTYFPFCMCNNITILEAVKQLNENAMKKFLFIVLFLTVALTYALAQQSGSCGDNLTWTLDENGTLTISGTGEMDDYQYYECGPWGKEITQLILEEGITHIGNYAFSKCESTGNLIFPASLTSIGKYAFQDAAFTGILTLPKGLTEIGSFAFYGCSGFTGSLTLPEGLTVIERSTFNGCSGFTGVLTLPKGLIRIDDNAFYECSGFTGTLTLPEGLTNIGNSAFCECSGFTGTLTLPEGLINIENVAFYRCSGFTDTLLLPETLLNIGSFVFGGCGFAVVLNENKTPIVIDADVFQNVNLSNKKLCVPAGSGPAYSQANVWKKFAIKEYGVGITPSFSENGGTVDCGTEISISTKPEAELYYGLGKDTVPTLRYTEPIIITDTTYISTYSRVRNVYSDTIRATYIPEHASFVGMDWDWSAEHKATLSLTCPRCETKIKPAVSLSEELTKEATEKETGLKTYTATATANEVTYKSVNREVLPQLTQPIHDTVVKTDTVTITEVKTDTVTITEVKTDTITITEVKTDTITVTVTDTVYIEVETGNGAAETMKVKLYPNPTNGSFTVEAEEDAYLQIYNAAGVCIQSKRMQGNRFTGTLPSSGLYFIKLTARNRTYTKRLIVQ